MTPSQHDPALLTIAESSNYTATATSDQVDSLLRELHTRAPHFTLTSLGKSFLNRNIPLLILSQPPVADPAAARALDKPVVFIMANIHAGEVEGKEVTLKLARELALTPNHPLLEKLTIILLPNYNPDGNDMMALDSRPGQVGPEHGQGQRPNAQGLDLNRDYIKLDAPESRALVAFLTAWDPDLTIDCHTTNGSHHRYVLTYDAPLNPSGSSEPISFVRNTLLPAVTTSVRDQTGFDMWFYGNFNAEHTTWETYSALPRFGGPYQGLRNQMSILSEAYSYADYKTRCLATEALILHSLRFAADHADEILAINRRARDLVTRLGNNPSPSNLVGIRHSLAAFPSPVLVKGFELDHDGEGGAAVTQPHDLGPPKDHLCLHLGRFEPTLSVTRPFAYLIPANLTTIIEKLHQHGISTQPLTPAGLASVPSLSIQTYTITSITREEKEFQNHRTVSLECSCRTESLHPNTLLRDGPYILVRTGQPLGTLAVYLLEPQSEDGLATWNFFDSSLHVGRDFPVLRLPYSPGP